MVDHGVDQMSESWGKQKSVCHFDEEFWINLWVKYVCFHLLFSFEQREAKGNLY
jgi:hypothetical protein